MLPTAPGVVAGRAGLPWSGAGGGGTLTQREPRPEEPREAALYYTHLGAQKARQ